MSQSLFSPKSDYIRLLRYSLTLLGALSASGVIAYLAVSFLINYPQKGDTGIAPDLSGAPQFLLILLIGWILPLIFFLMLLKSSHLLAKVLFFVLHVVGYFIIITQLFSTLVE